ncbi:KR domain-containing protein [Plectosphaerella plurivora]|uniref:KR domain-containing protein n=1 Tax=Plectosphaerella plurivora TaxID=936078 RepID=A0A9P8VFH6_9PEZI|nr:KR domain-containing protein [Plectosphaerella plurivora]
MGMRLPGGITDATGFWDLLVNGRDARSPIPASRYNIDGFDDSLGGKGAIKTRHGYFLSQDLAQVDTSFFSMTKNEVEGCDPQQRLLLEVVRECFEDAGEVDYRGKSVGCYVGTFGEDWLQMTSKDVQQSTGYIMTGSSDLMIANRVSYEYDLRGPSFVVKTACSASLVALHEACRSICAGDSKGAIVAGTSLIMGPMTTAAMSAQGILSPEGSCKTFDAKADGFARGEAITAVYLKPLEDAIRDGNPIRSVIRATGTNSDGRSHGIMNPRAEAHEALMRQVYATAGLDPGDTAFVECHGTGTPTGDPIETSAVGSVFGEKGVYIGSVKPNVGHGEGSSGITSLIKCVLALEHKVIPPNIKFDTPNPKIPFQEKKLCVPIRPTPFPTDRAERVSLNSFGIGGSNAHVILESYSGSQAESQTTSCVPETAEGEAPKLVVFSANTQPSLQKQVDLYKDYIRENPSRLSDVAYTRAVRREALTQRAFALARGAEFIEISPSVKTPGKAPGLFMIFSGQGAQWAGMGKEMIQGDAKFRADIEGMDTILQGLKNPPSWTIMDELLKPAEQSRIDRAELSQPLCTALQIALFHHLERIGVKADAVVGHSSGEIGAAYAAGFLTLEYAMALAYYRGLVTTRQTADGSMAAVGLGSQHVAPFLTDGVVVACENSPSSTTISGDGPAVLAVVAAIKEAQPDTFARALKVDMAYHSHHMVSLGREYLDLLTHEDLSYFFKAHAPQAGRPRFISSLTCKLIDHPEAFAPQYWVNNLVSPVRFGTAVRNLLETSSGKPLFLEIGPHAALQGPLRQICAAASTPCDYVSAQTRGDDSTVGLLRAIGRLYQEGVAIDLDALFPGGKVVPGLPRYPWDHSAAYWFESRLSKAWRTRQYPHHCLLGIRDDEAPEREPVWRNMLSAEDVTWLPDHKVRQDIVFPFAGYVALAGEAVRQTTGATEQIPYRLRHVVARTALVLSETKATELVTTLRRFKLTDSDDSAWYDFSVTSHNGTSWVRHCDGQVQACKHALPTSWTPGTQLRSVSTARFYEAMSKQGIVYGPEFQGLSNITSSVSEQLAEADVKDPSDQSRAPFFSMHPAAIDACIQLMLVATAKGLCRELHRLYVPTVIEEIDISPGSSLMHARAQNLTGDLKKAEIECIADGKVTLRIAGLQLAPLEDERAASSGVPDHHAAARLQWLPDFDFVDPVSLIQGPTSESPSRIVQERMTLLCILETASRIQGLTPCNPHFARYRDWIQMEVERTRQGKNTLVEDPGQYVDMSSAQRQKLIEQCLEALVNTEDRPTAVATQRVCQNVDKIFSGESDILSILMQDNILTEMYNIISFRHGDFVRVLAHSRPKLRILEVGAGTGGTTELILRDLVDHGGLPLYSTYTFTDISAGFFLEARKRFEKSANMDYKVFDITKSPFEQGFEGQEKSYDLILAANVVHATPSLKESLSNLSVLLKPDGMLILTELSGDLRASNYIFGNLSGWWLGEGDGRPWEPYISVERWDEELRGAGFAGVDSFRYDRAYPFQASADIIAKPAGHGVICPSLRKSSIGLLCESDQDNTAAAGIKADLEASGWDVTTFRLGDDLPEDQPVISCLDVDMSFFENITQHTFAQFQAFLRALTSKTKVLWLTRPTQLRCRDPRWAPAIGAIRTIRSELAVPFHTLEIEPDEPEYGALVQKVLVKVLSQEDTDTLASDKEFAVDGGIVYLPRCHPISLGGELRTVQAGKPGFLETLGWREEFRASSVGDGQVEIEARAVGLNFRDVLLASGMMAPAPSQSGVTLGLEASGIVSRVGPAVAGLEPGDRVMFLAGDGCLGTHTVVAAPLVTKIPESLSFESAATIPLCFATVLRALLDVGRLEKGQTVLVHSACGGIGLAAIQVCRMVGAEIYATVGSKEKVEFLVSRCGIPRDHIFHSRRSFVSDVLRQTRGRGVDLVLNSLAGELLHESWKCVAEFGVMVELGKRDLSGHGRLDMNPFLANRSYAGVDIFQLIVERPDIAGELSRRFIQFYDAGRLQPIDPVTSFESSALENAFRNLQRGDHIGKIAIAVTDNVLRDTTPAAPPAWRIEFDAEATYLLVGGVGGLGKPIAIWLAERGVKNITFLSRSAGKSKESKKLFREVEGMGCSVTAVAGSVDEAKDVERAIAASSSTIKGVFQLAMVLKDAPMIDMQWSQWTDVLRPKVQGTWNLHKAFLGHKLDFFWLASSLVTMVDQPGQGNYDAAQTFLEAFCQFRHSLGLPASVLNICPVEDVGYVAENAHAQRNVQGHSQYVLRERDFLQYLELQLLDQEPAGPSPDASASPAPWTNHAQVLMGLKSEQHLEDPSNRVSWRYDRRMGHYHNVRPDDGAQRRAENSAVKTFLARVAASPGPEAEALLSDEANVEFLAREIGQRVGEFLLRPDDPVDVGSTLAQIGLDSLVAVELRRWLKGSFGLSVSVLEMMGTGSLKEFGGLVAEKLKAKVLRA